MRNPAVVALLAVACTTPSAEGPGETPEPPSRPSRDIGAASAQPAPQRMTLHFYDVGEGLAALVDLPGGEHVLVDAGDRPRRAGCGGACEDADRHLIARLREDLRGAPLDLVWITHQHSDHIGGVPDVLDAFPVRAYVDNGRDPRRTEVARAHRAAREHGVVTSVVEPGHVTLPIPAPAQATLTPVVPDRWPASCAHDANECSIALRIDVGASSVLFMGDAEHEEEAMLDPHGPVTLLQVGHHGSETSSSPAFLLRARPRYAVLSAGSPGEGLNREYCHPRAIVVRRLTRVLSGPTTSTLEAFDGDRCDRAQASDWVAVPSSDALWATERDGDVVLTTTGDGEFLREPGPMRSASRLSRSRP